MQKHMSDYLDLVCSSIRGETLRRAARSELSVHLMERFEELTAGGMDEKNAAGVAVSRMGDPVILGKRISAANRPRWRVVSVIVSIVLVFAALVFTVNFSGGQIEFFFDFPSLIGVVCLSAAYGLISCGGAPTLMKFLRGFGTGSIYAGGICTAIGVVITLCNLSDWAYLGPGLAVAVMSIFYGLIFSAGARAVESWVAPPEPGSILKLIER